MADKPKKPVYLTKRFKPGLYNMDVFAGPRAGTPAIDFTATDLEGNEVKLSDFKGKWVVLETGSATCSMYTKNIESMEALSREFPDVEFLVVYVREAHPGERLGQHESFEEKKQAAQLLPKKYNENRRILIDSLDGDMHRTYGAMPNIVYVINPDGIVHYRCDWAHVNGVRKALEERDHIHTLEHADMADINAQRSPWIAIRTMWTGGIVALWDFVMALPTIFKKHKLVDEFYSKHGRFKTHPDEQLEAADTGAGKDSQSAA